MNRMFRIRAAKVGLVVVAGVATAGGTPAGASLTTTYSPAPVTTRVSVDSAGAQANHNSSREQVPDLSGDGNLVAFESEASNLVAGDTNGVADIFVKNRTSGAVTRVSVDSSGTQANDKSARPGISADGRWVVFESDATNLVAGDTNGTPDIFEYDRTTGTTIRVSVDSTGAQATGVSSFANQKGAVSGDGNLVAFVSGAANLVAADTNGSQDAFVHNRTTGATSRVSINSAGTEADGSSTQPAISDDGNWVAFASSATNLVPSDANGIQDVFERDLTTGTTSRVSVDSAGGEAVDQGVFFAGSFLPQLSANGRYVVFSSTASNLVVPDVNVGVIRFLINTGVDVFLHDRVTGLTELESVSSSGAQGIGSQGSDTPDISPDGNLVTFRSDAYNLVPGDTNGADNLFNGNGMDIFVRNRTTRRTIRVNLSSSGEQANSQLGHPVCGFYIPCSHSTHPAIAVSSGNAVVSYGSNASNLVANDTNNSFDTGNPPADTANALAQFVIDSEANHPAGLDVFTATVGAGAACATTNADATVGPITAQAVATLCI